MGIEGMEKARSRNAVSTPCALETRRIGRTGVATHDVVSRAARVIRIIDTELGMVENVEKLGPEFQLAGLSRFEIPKEGHVEVDAARII